MRGPVKNGGSHCYAGGKLTSWKLVVDNSYTSGFITGTSTTVPQLSSGKHQFFVQTWCRYGFVIGAGRSGSANGWIYSSGYQPSITVYLGLFTAG